jgi:type I restriction enzyme, S subunit
VEWLNAEIKERIEKIKKGEIPEGYKETNSGIVPCDWEVVEMNRISKRVRRINDGDEHPVLTISSLGGFLNQSQRFSKVIAGENLIKYTLLKKGEFSYNKGNSKTYPYGCIFMLEDYDTAVIPNVYYSFEILNDSKDYYKQYFSLGKLNIQLAKIINTGVRNDGLLNLSADDFFKCFVIRPPLSEQQKITTILSTWDKAIELKEQLIEEKKKQKKGLMKKLLTGEVRLPGFEDKWKEIKLGDLSKIVTGTTPSTKVLEYYNGEFPWITPTDIQNKKNISTSERTLTELGLKKGRYVPEGSLLVTCIASIGKNAILDVNGSCNQQINAIFPSPNQSNDFLYYLISYNTELLKSYAGISATPILNKETFSNIMFFIPKLDEQEKIAYMISSFDKSIDLCVQQLVNLKLQKKGLMQLLLTGIVRVQG